MSCKANKTSYNTIDVNINPKLIFLNYTITENANKSKTVTFINKTIADGKEKSRSHHYIKTGHIGDLKCSQLDKKSNILQNVFIKNPLLKTIEYTNDSLQFESKSLKLKKAALSIRLQLHPNTEHIKISEIIDSLQHTNTLIFTKLETE